MIIDTILPSRRRTQWELQYVDIDIKLFIYLYLPSLKMSTFILILVNKVSREVEIE